MYRTLRSAFLLALGVYLGIGVAVSVAGPAVFRALDSRTTAGAVFAKVLDNTTTADVILGIVLALLAALWLPRATRGLRRTATLVALVVMLAIIGYYKYILTPAMREHKRHIETFDTAEVDVHRAAFDNLHERYVRVYTANLIVCLATFAFAAGIPRASKA